jgi:hypothetical protein
MQYFAFFANLFFATPQILRFLLSTQLLDFVVVSAGLRKQEANYSDPRRQSASALFAPGLPINSIQATP